MTQVSTVLEMLHILLLECPKLVSTIARLSKRLQIRTTIKMFQNAACSRSVCKSKLVIDSYIPPECKRRVRVVIANMTRRRYYVVKLSMAGNSIAYAMRVGIFNQGDIILITPMKWYPIPGFANFLYVSNSKLLSLNMSK